MVAIEREVKINYDIDNLIKYDFFCSNKNLILFSEKISKIFDDPKYIRMKTYFWGEAENQLNWLFSYNLFWDYAVKRGINLDEQTIKHIHQTIENNYSEVYENLTEEKLDDITKQEFLWINLMDIIQLFFLHNQDVNIIPNIHINSQKDYIMSSFTWDMLDIQLDSVEYKITPLKSNLYNSLYILYCIFTSREEIYIVYKNSVELVICSEYNLLRNLSWSSIVINLTQYIKQTIRDETQYHLIDTFKDEYEKGHNNLWSYLKQIAELHNKRSGATIIDVEFRENDINKINEIDNNTNRGWVWFEYENWEKIYIFERKHFPIRKK